MYSIFFFWSAASFAICSRQHRYEGEYFPLGIELGSRYITAARYANNGQSQTILVAKVLGSPAYRDYMSDTLMNEGKRKQFRGSWYVEDSDGHLIAAPPETHDSDHAQGIFREALLSIQDAASSVLGEKADVMALCIPDHFNSSSRSSVIDAAIETTHIERPWQVIWRLNAARLAYGLNSCEEFGLDPQDCDIDEGPHRIVSRDYKLHALDLNVAEVNELGALSEYHDRVSIAGAGNEARATRIQGALLKLKDSAFKLERPRLGRFEFLRAVVLSGEVEPEAMKELRDAVVQAFPGYENEIHDSIDPLYVGSAGAAFKAKIFALNPDILRDDDENSISHGIQHDEL